jgi:hypothetical protein
MDSLSLFISGNVTFCARYEIIKLESNHTRVGFSKKFRNVDLLQIFPENRDSYFIWPHFLATT